MYICISVRLKKTNIKKVKSKDNFYLKWFYNKSKDKLLGDIECNAHLTSINHHFKLDGV